jgi:hypothetical protein
MEPVEPDLSLLERRVNLVPILLIVGLVVFGVAALVLSPPTKPRKQAPPDPRPPASARAPLLVSLLPADPGAAQGWCCAGGKVAAGVRAACETGQGVFFAVEKEARERCATATSGSPRGPGKGI